MDLWLDQTVELSRIREILKENPKGLTIEEIARRLPLNRTSTSKYLNTLLISGQAEMATYGRAKVFSLSQRVPFSQMLNLSSDLLLVLDNDLYINEVNEGFAKYFGVTRDSLKGLKLDQSPLIAFFSKENLNRIREAIRGSESTSMDQIDINGTHYFFKIKFIPCVFDQGGQGLTIILEDLTELKKHQDHLEQLVEERTAELKKTNERLIEEITERQKSRSALEKSERKYRELVENANSIILRTDSDGNITFFSEFAESFFGIPDNDVLGKNLVGTIIPVPAHTNKNPVELSREFLTPARHMMFKEAEVTRKNGEKVWVAWTIKELLDTKENFKEFLIVGLDITILKLYIDRSQKLVEDLETRQIELDAQCKELLKHQEFESNPVSK
jgi:PAS domain S-box-containing protein